MLTIKHYVRPQTLEEAYALCQKKTSVVLGGMLWLKMQDRTVDPAIDLCDLGLDAIAETEDAFIIGAMVSLRRLEMHKGLNEMTGGAVREAVKSIVGVQFRNLATVGGSLWGRFGFSDVLTVFSVLGARVRLYHRGEMTLEDFAALPHGTRDILTEIVVPKGPMRAVYLSQRNTRTDFPVLTCAASVRDGVLTCAVGARPGAAWCFTDEDHLLDGGITEESASAFGEAAAARGVFGSNVRASEVYRRRICAVLVRRALLALEEAEHGN